MTSRITLVALALYALAYLVLFGTWGALVFTHTTGADSIVGYIQTALGGLTGHVFTLIDPSRKWAADSPQSVP